MSDRDTSIFLSVFLGGMALIVPIVVPYLPWWAVLVTVIWLIAVLACFVTLQDPPRRAAIAAYLENPSYGRWYYSAIVDRVAAWPRDWRCYDWALRLAVAYPIFAMVLIWAASGQAGMIGVMEFCRRMTVGWQRLRR